MARIRVKDKTKKQIQKLKKMNGFSTQDDVVKHLIHNAEIETPMDRAIRKFQEVERILELEEKDVETQNEVKIAFAWIRRTCSQGISLYEITSDWVQREREKRMNK